MSRVFKSKKSWETTPVLEVEQLSLGPATSAPNARAELRDSAGKQGASGAELREWPAIGSRVLVRYEMYWTLSGELLEIYESPEADWPTLGNARPKRGRVLLDTEQIGLTDSLRASLPRVLADVALSQLRRPRVPREG